MNIEDLEIQHSHIGQFEDGLGVFAKKDFHKGEIVIEWNVRAISEEEYNLLSEYEKSQFCHERHGIIYLYPDPARHVNRSQTPNLISNFQIEADIALRDIHKGEELTISEATEEDF